MRCLSSVAVLVALSPFCLALPAYSGGTAGHVGRIREEREEKRDSGSLRGTEALLGDTGTPIDTSNVATTTDYTLLPAQDEPQDDGFYFDFTQTDDPQFIRGTKGGTKSSVANYNYDSINSDLGAPPGTDSGDVPNAKWPMGLSHNRGGLDRSGWARQQNEAVLPAATAMAGVNMHLEPHAYRELHWHLSSEWSLIFNGSCRVQAVDQDGHTFVDDLQAGDVWFFPPGIPHSIQAFDEGVEFLLVFDNGDFSEEETFLASMAVATVPKEVLAKDFGTDISALDNIPDDQLWIFPGTPAPTDISEQNITGPDGYLPKEQSYTYHFSQQAPYEVEGGSVKIIDPVTFPIAEKFSAALVTIQPGAMREIHWHLDSDEWNFFIQGQARVTVFKAPESARTFDFSTGDVGYIPAPQSHYIENTGDVDVIVLEVLQTTKFTDMSLHQWLALTPKQIVQDTLSLSDEVIARLSRTKPLIMPGNTNLTTTNFTTTAGDGLR